MAETALVRNIIADEVAQILSRQPVFTLRRKRTEVLLGQGEYVLVSLVSGYVKDEKIPYCILEIKLRDRWYDNARVLHEASVAAPHRALQYSFELIAEPRSRCRRMPRPCTPAQSDEYGPFLVHLDGVVLWGRYRLSVRHPEPQ